MLPLEYRIPLLSTDDSLIWGQSWENKKHPEVDLRDHLSLEEDIYSLLVTYSTDISLYIYEVTHSYS